MCMYIFHMTSQEYAEVLIAVCVGVVADLVDRFLNLMVSVLSCYFFHSLSSHN